MSTAKELKDEGNNHFKKEEYDQAIDCYSRAISLEPNDHVLYSNRSACYVNLKNHKKALEDADKCVHLNGTWWKGYHKQGLAYFGLGKLDKALECYKKGLELDSNNSTIKASIEELEQKKSGGGSKGSGGSGENDDQNPFAKNFHKLYTDPRTSKYMTDPKFVNMLQMGMKDPNMLTQMLGKDPRFMDVFGVLTGIDLTKMEEEQKKHTKESDEKPKERKKEEEEKRIREEKEKKEKEEKDRLAKLDPEELSRDNTKKEAEKIKQEGNEYFKKKDYEKALELYKQANKLNPDELTYYLNLAGAYHELKDYNNTITCCQHVVDHTGDFQKKAKAYGRMGFAFKESGDIDKCIECFDKSLLEQSDKNIKDHLKEAQALKKQLDAERYIDPALAEEVNTKANELYKAGKFVESIKEYSEAIKRNPKVAKYYSNRAMAFIKVIDIANALKDCDFALSLEPTNLRAYQRLGTCNIILKKYHRAIEAYENGLKHHPDDKELKEGLLKVQNLVRFGDGTPDEERVKRAMEDPEIAELVKHPRIQQLFKDFNENPKSAQEAVQKDPWIQKAFEKLVQAGVVKTH